MVPVCGVCAARGTFVCALRLAARPAYADGLEGGRTLFSGSADLYDAIYSFKDYAAESARRSVAYWRACD